jgi:hypothetical protein
MSIYQPVHHYPYVYKLTHKETGQFYFGYRSANKVPSSEDLGKCYTSGKTTQKNFQDFNLEIIAEVFTHTSKHDAYWVEQELIRENVKNKLILNKRYQNENTNTAFICHSHSEQTKEKMKMAHFASEQTKEKMRIGALKRPPVSLETRAKLSDANKGKKRSIEIKIKLSNIKKGKVSPNKGKKMSAKACVNMSLSAKNRPKMSEETKNKHREN